MPDVYISRQPLVNRQSKIIATRLTLHLEPGATTKDAAAALGALTEFWPQGEKLVFINCGQTPCDETLFEWQAPANATIEAHSASLVGPDAGPFIAVLQATPVSLCLLFESQTQAALASGVPFRFIALDAQRYTPMQLKSLATQTQPFGISVALNVNDGPEFQACLDAGVSAAASWFFMHPTKAPAKALNPGQAQIVRVLNLVRRNADVKEIEVALKQDVALSYKLLRYINSAGFGLSCEVQSFRHAVTILGYDKLNKWLSLLLATASKDPMAPALMHTALARARLMEVLATGLVEPQEYDNLFITGAFSMLDALLGVSMDKVLESMSLPASIVDALLGHGGVYGPFLELAKASEGDDGKAVADQASMLGLSADQFNRAQMQALAFADTMEL
ncbi:HDOD domain-containing protein [Propionivibrio sp.]|uniref:EAL and HDOD domain-containing protein n=1 Tax=Propionivibrio sp. TaxID=2212460 RepID=UPI00261915A1|nr:HDOD domain-containing protein [Propionivibrio sp.]